LKEELSGGGGGSRHAQKSSSKLMGTQRTGARGQACSRSVVDATYKG
jgi:hypothetical protein